MQSDAKKDNWPARLSDGQSAKSWRCTVRLEPRGLAIDRGDGNDILTWPYSALHSHTMLSRTSSEAIIESTDATGAQLFVRDTDFIGRLARVAPQITTRGVRRRWLTPVLALTAALVAAVALIWQLNIRPAQSLASLIPDSTRQSLGRVVIGQFKTKETKTCTSPAGQAALDKMLARLLKGVPKASLYKISVINLPIVNAFAVPGGQMVITEKLIRTARTPDEVAGILAHEIGHGIKRHPEAGLIRAFGLSFLLDLISGGSSGAFGSLGMLVLQTGYMRQDEFAADAEALKLLKQSGISQAGLGDFFARSAGCKRGKGKSSSEACLDDDKNDAKQKSFVTFDLLRTHPYPKERLKVVRGTSDYPATPALSGPEWQALRRICSK